MVGDCNGYRKTRNQPGTQTKSQAPDASRESNANVAGSAIHLEFPDGGATPFFVRPPALRSSVEFTPCAVNREAQDATILALGSGPGRAMIPKLTLCLAPLAFAASAGAQEGDLTREELAATLPGVQASDIHDSPLPGMYQIVLDSDVVYISRDGSYLIQGDVFDLQGRQNLTERRRARARADILAGVDPDSMIVFSPEPENIRHTVTVFTDIDCGFCRQLHREMDRINALGIEVRYLSYPRTGPDTASWFKANHVWCAGDRQAAFTEAILQDVVPEQTCDATPVALHFDLGRQVSVRGTPTILTGDGVQLGGYVAPDELIASLEALAEESP